LLRRLTAVLFAVSLLTPTFPFAPAAFAEPSPDDYSGSDLWLRYVKLDDRKLLDEYGSAAAEIVVQNAEATKVFRKTENLTQEAGAKEALVEGTLEAARNELAKGLDGLLGVETPISDSITKDGAVIVGTPDSSPIIGSLGLDGELGGIGDEGYIIKSIVVDGHKATVIAANTDVGALYGTFGFLRLIQTEKSISDLNIAEQPKVKNRHLDNWETTRLYAGNNAAGTGGLNGENGTIFNFTASGASAGRILPLVLDRYIVLARACASIGINGIEINLVNANNAYLTNAYIAQEAALADVLRPYGIKISLAINYTAPTDNRFAPDTLTNSQLDPYGEPFRDWWNRKASQIKESIPDFMGFTVKANSEGQPGPQDFGYDHGDGANGIAGAISDLGMKVYWRTFVYNANVDNDRLKRAYLEFGYINDEEQDDGSEGRFLDNVFLQTKTGPLDFQGREPFHPMFGRMDNTNQAMEMQITQEYTGQDKMLCFLAPMWEEVLKADTYAEDDDGVLLENRLVGNVLDGSAQGHTDTAMVGVANLGNADNMTGHHFAQANFFAFGRQAWDWTLNSEDIAEDWVRMTWSNDKNVVDTIVEMMMGSWEALVSYQTPLGIGHQFYSSNHYPPMPSQWTSQDDWSPVYYNKADSAGLGFDRSPSGSNFVSQYFPTLESLYGDIDTCPENLLMWFHHVPWDRSMSSGRIFWDELVYRYQMGVQYVTGMRDTWDSLSPYIDARRFAEVKAKLATHENDASSWRDTSVNYWKEFSGMPIPVDGGPLSAKFTIAGKQFGGFNLSSPFYTIRIPYGASPVIRGVKAADPAASYEIVSQADGVPGQAVVKLTKNDFFGKIVKNYTLNIVYDTSLKSLKVNGNELDSYSPDVTSYNVVLSPGSGIPEVTATAADPAATVSTELADGLAVVTVTNNGARSVYTINCVSLLDGSDEFDSPVLKPAWSWLREDSGNWSLSDEGGDSTGFMTINAQTGDLQAGTNTAKNVLLQDVVGDWFAETKVVFSRPLSANNEQGGIIAYGDDNNYVKLGWEMSNAAAPINKLRVIVLREQNNAATTAFQITGSDAQKIVGEGGAIWFRLVKNGNNYTSYYSGDGVVYRFIGTTTLNYSVSKAGLYAFNRAGTSTDLQVGFDYFRIANLGEHAGNAQAVSVTANKADKTVAVSASGFSPNQQVSLWASYGYSPGPLANDYSLRAIADAAGNIQLSLPDEVTQAASWLGGERYFVSLNGSIGSAQILATEAKVNSSARINLRLRQTLQLGYQIDGVAYEFTSSNPSVASVDPDGLVTPVRAGSAVITLRATDGSNLVSSLMINITP
jgi:alpha-glucuronidase